MSFQVWDRVRVKEAHEGVVVATCEGATNLETLGEEFVVALIAGGTTALVRDSEMELLPDFPSVTVGENVTLFGRAGVVEAVNVDGSVSVRVPRRLPRSGILVSGPHVVNRAQLAVR